MDTSQTELTVDEVASNLMRHGAPLLGDEAGGSLDLEEALAHGVRTSRHSGAVCRVWPVTFARNAKAVDVEKLMALATEFGERRACGWLLEATGMLMGDSALVATAESLREELPEPEYFFHSSKTSEARKELARRKSDELSKRWSFWTASPYDLFFEACYVKHMRRQTNGTSV